MQSRITSNFSYPNISSLYYVALKPCFDLAAKTETLLLESTLERVFLQLGSSGVISERAFINMVLAGKQSLTAHCLNEIINKLVEVNVYVHTNNVDK